MTKTATIKALLASLLLTASSAQAVILDFEDFDPLGAPPAVDFQHGTVVNSQYFHAEFGEVTISAVNENGTKLAVVFDSNERSTEDPDLENPFENKNNNPLIPASENPDRFNPGNILIIQEDSNNCSTTSCDSPDDEGTRPAGFLLFEFEKPVNLISLDFFDIETAGENSGRSGSELEFLDKDGLEIYSDQFVPGTGGGDGNNTSNKNTWDRLFFSGLNEVNGIRGLRVNLYGSGAIDRLEYSVVPVPAAFWLFGTALIGFIGFSRRTSV